MMKIVIMVYLINHAGLSDVRIDEIKKSTAWFFADAGISISWSDEVVLDRTLNVLLTDIASSKASCRSKNDDALGCAFVDEQTHRGSLAYVFVKLADKAESDAGMLLSGILLPRVIAHEIGHLLGLSHTNGHEGIMRKNGLMDPRKNIGVRWTKSERKALFDALQTAE